MIGFWGDFPMMRRILRSDSHISSSTEDMMFGDWVIITSNDRPTNRYIKYVPLLPRAPRFLPPRRKKWTTRTRKRNVEHEEEKRGARDTKILPKSPHHLGPGNAKTLGLGIHQVPQKTPPNETDEKTQEPKRETPPTRDGPPDTDNNC